MNQVKFIWLLLFGYWMVFYRKKSLPKYRYYFDIHFLYRYFSYIDIDIITPLVRIIELLTISINTLDSTRLGTSKFNAWNSEGAGTYKNFKRKMPVHV